MKLAFVGILAVAALAATNAQAAVPKVTGKYAVIGSALCSARTGETGILSAITGYMTFKPASMGAVNGTATFTAKQIRGRNHSANASGGWSTVTINMSGNYSATANTVVFDGETWIMSYGNVAGGIARTVNMIRRETGDNPDCVDALTLTKQ